LCPLERKEKRYAEGGRKIKIIFTGKKIYTSRRLIHALEFLAINNPTD